jgi:hypothetical protein
LAKSNNSLAHKKINKSVFPIFLTECAQPGTVSTTDMFSSEIIRLKFSPVNLLLKMNSFELKKIAPQNDKINV